MLLNFPGKDLFPIEDKLIEYIEEDCFDIIEYLFKRVSKPIKFFNHTWSDCGLHVAKGDIIQGKNEFREQINNILEKYNDGKYKLDNNGKIFSKSSDQKEYEIAPEQKQILKEQEKEREPYLENIKVGEETHESSQIFIGCVGTWEVNILNFKVKVQNNTKYSITDVKIILGKYPSILQLESDIIKTTHKLGPNGELWTPEFRLNAGNEYVSGGIHTKVMYYDSEEQNHTIDVRPFEISYICPLLEAKNINKEDYQKKTKNMYCQEQQLIFEQISDLNQFKEEMKKRMEGMNLAVIDLKGSVNEIAGYAEDKFHQDGLGLEAKIESIRDNQTEILLNLKVLCEREDKCSPLLYKALQELSTLGLSVEKLDIKQTLNMFIERPHDLTRYIVRVIKSDWSEVKKDKWADVIREILEDWKEFKPKKWERIARIILKIVLGKIVGEELSGYLTIGIQNLFDWIKTNLS